MTNALEVESLQKSYGDVDALRGVSLTVPDGSFFGLLGPNGAGKTTFINVLVGLVRATGGEARVFGHDVEADYREARDRIGLAPQEFNVDSRSTRYSNTRPATTASPARRPQRGPSAPSNRWASTTNETPGSTGSLAA